MMRVSVAASQKVWDPWLQSNSTPASVSQLLSFLKGAEGILGAAFPLRPFQPAPFLASLCMLLSTFTRLFLSRSLISQLEVLPEAAYNTSCLPSALGYGRRLLTEGRLPDAADRRRLLNHLLGLWPALVHSLRKGKASSASASGLDQSRAFVECAVSGMVGIFNLENSSLPLEAYWARLFACGLDLVELMSTGCLDSIWRGSCSSLMALGERPDDVISRLCR